VLIITYKYVCIAHVRSLATSDGLVCEDELGSKQRRNEKRNLQMFADRGLRSEEAQLQGVLSTDPQHTSCV
jgi:hypothetical protein